MLSETLSYVLGATSVVGLYLAGKHDWKGWAVTFLTEPIWGWFAIVTHSWGLLIATFAYAWVSAWNLVKWRRERG